MLLNKTTYNFPFYSWITNTQLPGMSAIVYRNLMIVYHDPDLGTNEKTKAITIIDCRGDRTRDKL